MSAEEEGLGEHGPAEGHRASERGQKEAAVEYLTAVGIGRNQQWASVVTGRNQPWASAGGSVLFGARVHSGVGSVRR